MAAGQIQHLQAAHLLHAVAGFQMQVRDLLPEADLAAQRDDARAQVLHHAYQLEGADVRMRLHQDFGRRACGNKFFHDLAPQMARVFDLAPQLAVREGSRSALTELHIAVRMQIALAPQIPGVLRALAHRRTALQYQGPEPHLCEQQRGKHAAGAETHDHRAHRQCGGCLRHPLIRHVRRGADVRVRLQTRQNRRFYVCLKRHVDNENCQYICFARIKAAFENPQFGDVVWCHAQSLRRQRTQGLDGLGQRQAVGVGFAGRVGRAACGHRQRCEREFEFSQADHAGSWLSSKPG